MSRKLVVAAAQLGAVNLDDDRAAVVARLVAMLQEAAGRLIEVIERLTPAQSGGFYDYSGAEVPW